MDFEQKFLGKKKLIPKNLVDKKKGTLRVKQIRMFQTEIYISEEVVCLMKNPILGSS